jgi:hypothetical protein
MRAGRPKIAFVSQPEYFRFSYEQDLDDVADVREFELFRMLERQDFSALIEFDADYIFFFRGEFVPAQLLTQLSGKKIALSSEPFPRKIDGQLEKTTDSVLRYLHFRQIRSLPFDYLFHYDASSLGIMSWDGIHCSGHFAFPVATDTYRPPSSPKDTTWDLFFIGRSTDHRERFFGPLKHRHNFLHICHGLWGTSLVDYVNRSKICLNVHAENEVSWEPRVQMLMACRTLLISEKITPNTILRPGIDYVEANSPGEMYAAAQHYLSHPEEREAIAHSGHARVLELLSGKRCYLDLIAGIESGLYPPMHTTQAAWSLEALSSLHQSWRNIKNTMTR